MIASFGDKATEVLAQRRLHPRIDSDNFFVFKKSHKSIRSLIRFGIVFSRRARRDQRRNALVVMLFQLE